MPTIRIEVTVPENCLEIGAMPCYELRRNTTVKEMVCECVYYGHLGRFKIPVKKVDRHPDCKNAEVKDEK